MTKRIPLWNIKTKKLFAFLKNSYNRFRKKRNQTSVMIYKKKGKSGVVTVEKGFKPSQLIIKRDGKTLSGIYTKTKKPTSNLYSYPHIIDLFPYKITRILCLGAGACAYPIYALSKNRNLKFDVIDNDSTVIHAANTFFPLPKKSFNLINYDGLKFLINKVKSKYDLIFVDVGIIKSKHLTRHNNLKFQTKRAIKLYHKHLTKNGILIFNIISTSTIPDLSTLNKTLLETFSSIWAFKVTLEASPDDTQDIVVIAHNSNISLHTLEKKLNSISPTGLSYKKSVYQNIFDSQLFIFK